MLTLTIIFSLGLSVALAVLMLIWFKTNAFSEYAKVFYLEDVFHITQFDECVSFDTEFSYPKFLAEHFNCFFTRLISCPICISTWFAGITNLALYTVTAILFLSPFTILWMVPGFFITVYLSLFLYFKLVNLMS